jgi:hypothetical protein
LPVAVRGRRRGRVGRPLAEASAALRHVADGKAIGKVVLEIGLASPPWRLASREKERSVRSFLRSAFWRVT